MKQSSEIKDLAAALAKAQGVLEKVNTDETAHVKSEKGNFSYKYASLAGVLTACRQALSENDLAVIQTPEGDPVGVTVTTRLIHSSGQWIESSLTVRPTKPDIQGMGSAITYARRYSLMAIIGIAPEDDDGVAAIQPAAPQQNKRVNQPASKPQPQPAQVSSIDPSVTQNKQSILKLMVKNKMKLEEVLQVCGLAQLGYTSIEAVTDPALLDEADLRLNAHVQEVRQA